MFNISVFVIVLFYCFSFRIIMNQPLSIRMFKESEQYKDLMLKIKVLQIMSVTVISFVKCAV